VRRLAYEAADCGLLSSDLAAGKERFTKHESGTRRNRSGNHRVRTSIGRRTG
jgi:hypothetical protein